MEAEMQPSSPSAKRIFGTRQVVLMSAGATHGEALPFAIFSEGTDAHWETEIRTVWNARQFTAEKHELVYEVSWISDLGVWRRFLRSDRAVKA